MLTEDIRPAMAYQRSGSPWRRVVSVNDTEVIYTVEGLFTLQPLRMEISKFAAWAEVSQPIN